MVLDPTNIAQEEVIISLNLGFDAHISRSYRFNVVYYTYVGESSNIDWKFNLIQWLLRIWKYIQMGSEGVQWKRHKSYACKYNFNERQLMPSHFNQK